MTIEKRDKGGMMDSYTPGAYSGCGCGSRRYYTKAEIDEMLANVIDEDKIKEILDQMFDEYIESGDLYELILSVIGDVYTMDEIDELLANLDSKNLDTTAFTQFKNEMEECCNDVKDTIDYLTNKVSELEDIISQITGDTPSPDPGPDPDPDTGDTDNRPRIIVTYNVTSTTEPTQILYTTGTYLNEIRDENKNEVPISLYYTFPSLGEHTLTFYYSRNTFSDSSQWKGLKQIKKAKAIIISPGTSAFEGSSLQELHSRNGASYAYRNCTQLVSVAFADGWGSVQSAEFDGCTSLVSDFVVSNAGTKIYQNAFRNTKITSLTIASTVKWISPCLDGCQDLQYVRFLGVTPPETIKSGAFDGNYPIYVPSSAVDTYKTALPSYTSRIQAWTGQ